MDLPSPLELKFGDALKQIESEKQMPYVTSIERLAKHEDKIEGQIQLLQELLGLPVIPNAELANMAAEKLEALLLDLRHRVKSR